MDVRIVMFLALVFIALVWNTALLVVIWMRLKRVADGAAAGQPKVDGWLRESKDRVRHLEAASARACERSEAARERAIEFGSDLDRVDHWCRYGLATVDFEMAKASLEIDGASHRIRAAIREPLQHAAVIIQSVELLLQLIDRGTSRTANHIPE